MGFIRGFFLVIVSVLLLFSLLSMNFLWILSSSLTFDNVQKQSVVAVDTLLVGNINITNSINEIAPQIQTYCNSSNYSYYVFNEAGYTLSIPCGVASQGSNAIMGALIKSAVKNIYYTNYNCTFWNCVQSNPLFLVSEQSYNYWNSKFYLFIIISAVLAGLVFLLVKRKANMFILTGSLLIIASLPFIKLEFLLSLFTQTTFFKLLDVFFSQAYPISIITIIIGIALIILGIVLKIFKIGFSIENFISKFKKPEVKVIQKKIQNKPIVQKQITKNIVKKPMKKSK